MRSLPADTVYSRDEARALGWTDSALARAVNSGRLVRLRRGFFAATPATDYLAAAAAVRAVHGSAISHRSGLLLHELPLVGARPRWPELTVVPDGSGGMSGVLLHRAAMPSRHLTEIGGVPVLTPARTLIDVARGRPVATAVPAMDAALHSGLVTTTELDDVLLACWNWPGIRRAQRALRLSNSLAESPLESVSRLVIRHLGLPAPQLQPVILDPHGRELGRLDFYWDRYGVAGEADGRSKYVDGAVLLAEKERQELLEDAGLVVVRWGWEQPWRRPHALRARVEAAFARGAARDRSGFPRQWSVVTPATAQSTGKPDRQAPTRQAQT